MLPVQLSLQSFNFRDRFMRHNNFLGELDPVSPGSGQEAQDATFDIVPGLADEKLISFRSVNFPDRFLRHKNFRLQLDPPGPEDTAFNADATFIIVPGLVNTVSVGEVEDKLDFLSFRSLNFPTLYIRHRVFHLFLEDGSQDPPGPGPFPTSNFEEDASFRLVQALFSQIIG